MTLHKLNLIFALLSLPLVLQPSIGHCRPLEPVAVADPAKVTLDHISIEATGKGSPIFLIPGLSSPRETWDRAGSRAGEDAPRLSRPGQWIWRRRAGREPEAGHSRRHRRRSRRVYRAQPDQGRGDRRPFDGRAGRADVRQGASRGRVEVDDRRFAALCRQIFLPDATVAMVEPRGQGDPRPDGRRLRQARQRRHRPRHRRTASRCKPDSRAKVKAWAMAADPRVTGRRRCTRT